MSKSQSLYDQLPSNVEMPKAGQFIMSGSFTVLPAVPSDAVSRISHGGQDSTVMPGFHRKRKVKRTLRALRRNFARWQRIQGPEAGSARDSADRFLLPQHLLNIR